MPTSRELDNLVKTDLLSEEPPTPGEVESLQHSGEARLKDASNADLALESRFDLAYNASHTLALAALRRLGYRPNRKRFVVFQALEHTLGLPPARWRVLDKAHNERNRVEYEGDYAIDERLVEDVIEAAKEVSRRLGAALRAK